MGLQAISTSPSAASTSSRKDRWKLGKRRSGTVRIHGSFDSVGHNPRRSTGPKRVTSAKCRAATASLCARTTELEDTLWLRIVIFIATPAWLLSPDREPDKPVRARAREGRRRHASFPPQCEKGAVPGGC